jgi:hypothetical protein
VILFASSTLVFAWFPLVRTLLFGRTTSFLCICHCQPAFRWHLRMVDGDRRVIVWLERRYPLLFAPAFPGVPVLDLSYLRYAHQAKINSLVPWRLHTRNCPEPFLFLSSPDAFQFDNLRYHAIKSNNGLIGWWQEKFAIVLMIFLGGPEGNGIQNSILFFVSLGFMFSIRKLRYPPWLALQIAFALVSFPLFPLQLCRNTSVCVSPSLR